jgi:hypothetical protein
VAARQRTGLRAWSVADNIPPPPPLGARHPHWATLWALRSYNTAKGPRAFELLAAASSGARRGHSEAVRASALLSSLGCTHPDSNARADRLRAELEWMQRQGASGAGAEGVGTKIDYFSL